MAATRLPPRQKVNNTAEPVYPAWMDSVLFVGLALTTGLTLLVSYRVIRGPTMPDRVVAFDIIGTNVVAIAALYAIWSQQGYFVGVSLMLTIIGFISMITVARYVTEGDIIE